MKCYAAVADWEGYLQWKTSNINWSEATESSANHQQQCSIDLVEFFDKNIPLQWPDRTSIKVAEWSVDSLMDEAKSSMLVAADRIRSSRSIYSTPDSAWKIMQYLTGIFWLLLFVYCKIELMRNVEFSRLIHFVYVIK